MNTENRRIEAQRIELHINELVLHGFAARDRRSIGAAIERELGRLLAARGVQAFSATEVERVDAGSFKVSANPNPQTVGRHVAQRVYGQLSSARTTTTPAPGGGAHHV